MSEMTKARAWLQRAIEDGYVDESGMHDTDKYPDENWRHLKVLANASCATCKWAEAVGPRRSVQGEEYKLKGDDAFPLLCRKIDESPDNRMPTHEDALAWAVDMESYRGNFLRVAPTFGCVLWEGK